MNVKGIQEAATNGGQQTLAVSVAPYILYTLHYPIYISIRFRYGKKVLDDRMSKKCGLAGCTDAQKGVPWVDTLIISFKYRKIVIPGRENTI
jgi:hypothetical protein